MKRIRAIAIALVVVAVLLCGCAKENSEDAEESGSRFEVEYYQRVGAVTHLHILRDTETGRAYLFIKSGYGGGLTLMPED